MLPKEIQELIALLPPESQVAMQAVIVFYESRIEILEARLKELEDQLSKNSRNSSKPPSTDGLEKPAPKSLRAKSERKVGGQAGHKEYNLKMIEHPDFEQKAASAARRI